MRPILPFLTVAFSVLTACASAGSPVKQDEVVVFFPTDGYLDGQRLHWNVPVHGWIFEPETDSGKRRLLLDQLASELGLEAGTAEDRLFRERAALFLVDNERGKKIVVRSGSVSEQLTPSGANGHFHGTLRFAKDVVPVAPGQPWFDFEADLPPADSRQFSGRAQLLGAVGVSVVSDIDDTIKISEVLDKRALLKNTFLKPFLPVSGMAKAYRGWMDAGAAFHYVSSSPWQLYPSLQEFIESSGFPPGSISLRLFRLKDSSLLEFMFESEQYKLDTIRGVLERFPARRFILVGDAGEKDPEIYGVIAREFPRQVAGIYIRDVGRVRDEGPRMHAAFRGVPKDRWMLFRDPRTLEAEVLSTGAIVE